MNTYTQNKTRFTNFHFLPIFLLFFSFALQAQNRLTSTSVIGDTVRTNAFVLGGNAGQVLMADGTSIPAASAAGQILTTTSSGTPTWASSSGSGGSTYSLLTQANIGGSQNGLGVNTNSPSALLHVNATGYTANNIFTVMSSGDVTPVINTNGGANFAGYSLQKNNDEKWFIGLPANTNAEPLNNLIIRNTTNGNSPGVGINTGNATSLFTVNGTMRAKGFYYNLTSFAGTSAVNLTENDDYYIAKPTTSGALSINLPAPSANLTGKRMVIKTIGSNGSTVTVGCNPVNTACFLSGTNSTSATQTGTVGTTFIFFCDGTNWLAESRHSN